jgi:hypothetical protein
LVEWITVISSVANKSNKLFPYETFFESIEDKGDFMRASRRCVDGERNTSAICHCHEFRPLATLGFSDTGAPFFATTKVASI